MSEGKITSEKRGHVTLIGIDRTKKRNAFDTAMYKDLSRAFGEIGRASCRERV